MTIKTIKFSHVYDKLLYSNTGLIKEAVLLEVFRANSEDFHKGFIDYDTLYFDKQSERLNFYKLPKGEVLVLLFKACINYIEDYTDRIFTTIRRFTPEKFKYYKEARGEVFNVEIVK